MGSYLNPGNKGFRESLNSQIYVDKSGLIEQTNAVLDTREKYMCVSRPRRFGKSMTIDMMTAYYDQNCESETLFSSLEISQKDSYQKHLNQYDVIRINMQEFLSVSSNVSEMLALLQKRLLAELQRKYPKYTDGTNLVFYYAGYLCRNRSSVCNPSSVNGIVFSGNTGRIRRHRESIWISCACG